MWLKSKKLKLPSVYKDSQAIAPSDNAHRSVLFTVLWRAVWTPLIKTNICWCYDPAIPVHDIYPGEKQTHVHKDLYADRCS